MAREFVDWLISRGEASSRIEAVDIGKQLLDAGVFRHGTWLALPLCGWVCVGVGDLKYVVGESLMGVFSPLRVNVCGYVTAQDRNS